MSGLFCTILTNLSKDASAEPSLIEELWKYLSEKYFTLDMGQYENLGFSLTRSLTENGAAAKSLV